MLNISRARLEYDITQQPAFVGQLGSSYISLLKAAAASHRVALDIEQDHADVLLSVPPISHVNNHAHMLTSNFAQVCSSLAETIHDHFGESKSSDEDPLALLRNSLSSLEKCFQIQETQFNQMQQGHEERNDDEDDIVEDPTSDGVQTSETTEEEMWAAIVEPTTAGTLLDTSLAQLDVLKLLCSFQSVAFPNDMELIENIYASVVKDRVDGWSQKAESTREAVLENIAFLCAFATARFRLGNTAVSSFADEFNSSIVRSEILAGLDKDAEASCMIADSQIDFNTTLEDRLLNTKCPIPNDESELLARIRWKSITAALDRYSTASKIPGVQNLIQIHISRGDCELLRSRLGEEPLNYGVSSKSEATLLGNAHVYYNAARKALSLQVNLRNLADVTIEIEAKIAFVQTVRDSQSHHLTSLIQKYGISGLRALQNMKEERLVGDRRWAFTEALLQNVP